jgi:biofilm PGA synthesis protein PgaA
VHAYYEHATIDEITADYQRLGVGLEHVIAGVGTVEAEVQQEFYLNNDSSLVLGGTFDLNDQWQFMARADSNAIEVPLRARYDEISGSIAELGLAYRANERIAASVNAGELQMSDNNLRQTMSLTAMTKVVQGPVYNATLGVELSVSRNSLENTAYFNPKSDHTEQISYTSEWLNYQRYDRSFKQTLVLSIGRYTEEGFATGAISSVSYQHDVQASDVVNLSYGVGYVSRLYSGVESFGPEANLSFTWKF